jgi:hypothetical protein
MLDESTHLNSRAHKLQHHTTVEHVDKGLIPALYTKAFSSTGLIQRCLSPVSSIDTVKLYGLCTVSNDRECDRGRFKSVVCKGTEQNHDNPPRKTIYVVN